jgi:hypothetical protein
LRESFTITALTHRVSAAPMLRRPGPPVAASLIRHRPR